MLDDRLALLDLSFAQARSLVLMLVADEPLTPSVLATLILQEVQSVSGLTDRLQSRGLIKKEAHPLDRRSSILTLTQEGQVLAQESLGVFRAATLELPPGLETLSGCESPLERLRDFAIASVPLSLASYKRALKAFWKNEPRST
ncbi:MAG: MarR family transcriptional regulator [Dehalococcoidia bacterium]|nr:MarR family transcriptional regulator [Dehalococcoidia bacterium]